FVFSAWKDSAIDRWVGDLSYPMYLCHLLIVALVLTYNPPFAAWVGVVATFALSAVLLVAIDRPVDRWRQRRLAIFAEQPQRQLPGAMTAEALDVGARSDGHFVERG